MSKLLYFIENVHLYISAANETFNKNIDDVGSGCFIQVDGAIAVDHELLMKKL